jgi:hypothetical protein
LLDFRIGTLISEWGLLNLFFIFFFFSSVSLRQSLDLLSSGDTLGCPLLLVGSALVVVVGGVVLALVLLIFFFLTSLTHLLVLLLVAITIGTTVALLGSC